MKKPSPPASKAPDKPADKPAGKAAAAPAGKPVDEALPDAALLDKDGAEGEETAAVAAPKRRGLGFLLPKSALGRAMAASLTLIMLGSAGFGGYKFATRPPAPEPSYNLAGPARAIDGGTVQVAGQAVRLLGIEAPPADLVCKDGGWEYKCGEEARAALEKIIANRPVDCARGGPKETVARCFSEQGADLAAVLVEAGWAIADIKKTSRYLPQQAKAQDENRGLWRNDFARPEQWRLAGGNSGGTTVR